jgi:hypothetical protein
MVVDALRSLDSPHPAEKVQYCNIRKAYGHISNIEITMVVKGICIKKIGPCK